MCAKYNKRAFVSPAMLLTKIIKMHRICLFFKKVLSCFRVMLAKQDGFDWHGHTQKIVEAFEIGVYTQN